MTNTKYRQKLSHQTSRLKLRLPVHLYSRQQKLARLLDEFNTMYEANKGDNIVCLLSGESGAGKSKLVQDFFHDLLPKNRYLLNASFNKQTREIPYYTISLVLRQMVDKILQEDSSSILLWKESLKKAFKDGTVLYDFVPRLEQLLGTNPVITASLLGNVSKKKNKFSSDVHKFFRACCHTAPPLILVLEDLHDADEASIHVLEHLLLHADIPRLFFIGTYKTVQGKPDNCIEDFLKKLTTRKILKEDIEHITVIDIEEILSLSLDKPGYEVTELAEICLEKTAGNQFYLKQYLHSLNRSGLICYDEDKKIWNWDEYEIVNRSTPEKLSELVQDSIDNISEQSRKILETASCIGRNFTTDQLTPLFNLAPDEIENHLTTAVYRNLLSRIEESVIGLPLPSTKISYQFAHELVQELLYSSLPLQERQQIHLKSGYYLFKVSGSSLYETASQLNKGLPLIQDGSERIRIATINLDVGSNALETGAYSSALYFLQSGIAALPENSWKSHYSLSLNLYEKGSEAAYLCQQYTELDRFFSEIEENAEELYDLCQAYRIRIWSLNSRNKPIEALNAGRMILAQLGITIPENPGKLRLAITFILTRLRLTFYSSDTILAKPPISDKRVKTIMGFLLDIGFAAYSTYPEILPIISSHAIRLSLKYGQCTESAIMGYQVHGFLMNGRYEHAIETGTLYGKLPIKMQQYSTEKAWERNLTSTLFTTFFKHWTEPVRETITEVTDAVNQFREDGLLDISANLACSATYRNYLAGINLNRVKTELDSFSLEVENIGQLSPLNRLKIYLQAVSNLKGNSEDPVILEGKYFKEHEKLTELENAGDFTAIAQLYVIKMIHSFIFNRYSETITFSGEAEKYINHLISSIFIPVYYFYDALARLSLYETFDLKDKIKTRLRIRKILYKMRIWANYSPKNYLHKLRLIEAEVAKIQGKTEQAMELYDSAIQQARDNEYLQDEALAYECASHFYLRRNKPHIARPYMREARYCYFRWGAKAKVSHLDTQDWLLSAGEAMEMQDDNLQPSVLPLAGEGGSRLDMMTVIKASRILSSEMVMDELLKKIMRILLESSGAQRGFLIFRENGSWVIRVKGSIYRKSIVTLTDKEVEKQNIASTGIINYVISSATDVILNNACKEGLFTNDPYIQQKKPQSVLCMPAIHQGEVFCILYLENNIITGAFPPDRQELLHLLVTQAAISLKNSRLFEELETLIGRLNKEIEKRKSTQLQLMHAEKLTALGRLSASIAHEFGNPLIGVKYLIDDFYKRDTTKESDKQLLKLGLDECERMKKLISNLQRLNKPSLGTLELIDIHQLIDNVLLFQKKHITTNKIKIEKSYDHSIPEVPVITDQISQVLINLIMNSVDAMTDAGGVLKIKTKRVRDGLHIDVTDNGIGIPYEEQGQIFEPFYSSKKEQDGTGLGLSISYGIIQHHKGRLSFSSKPNSGATFTIFLPFAQDIESTSYKEKNQYIWAE